MAYLKWSYSHIVTLKKHMNTIEKIYTLPDLIEMVKNAVKNHQISNLLDDFIEYYKTEFNF